MAVWLAGTVVLAGPTALAFAHGGFRSQDQLLALAGALVVLALLGARAPASLGLRGLPLLSAILLATLAGWTAASIAWAPIADAAVGDLVRLLLYLSAFVGALVVMGVGPLRRVTPAVLLAGITIVALYALAGRLLPELVSVAITPSAGERLDQPLSYWNAMGILMAFGVLLAAAVGGDEDRRTRPRILAAAAAVPCGVVLYLTFSRGPALALVAGLVTLLAISPRKATLAAAVVANVGTVALALALQGFPAVLGLRQGPEQASQGAQFALIVGAVTVAVAVIYWRLLRGRAIESELGIPRGLRVAGVAATVVALLGASIAVAYGPQEVEPLPTSEARLAELRTNRGAYWRVALESFAERPVAGGGAGSFRVDWRREREIGESVVDAHSLYLETLTELGFLGGILLAAFLATAVVGAFRLARRRPTDPVLTAGGAVLLAFAFHAGIDWDWEMPAVTLPPLLLLAAVLRGQETGREQEVAR